MSFFVRQSKFRHVYVKPMKREFCMEDVRITKVSWDSTFCSVNPKFIAVITEGAGGPFMVIPLNKTGRIEKDYPVVDAHKGPCLDVAWCPFNDNVIASCSEDSTAKVWHIPDGGLHRNLKEPMVELLAHQKRVNCILWHPSANNILLTAGSDQKIFLWNIGNGEALIEIAGHPDLIWSVAFNYNGSKLVTTCKDKKIRVVDPRTGRILQQGQGHEGMKPQRAVFLKDGRIFTTGFTKRSERSYSLRDEEAIDEPIVCEELDTNNAVLFPFYDPDTNLLYLCGKGDGNIRYYEVNNEPPFVHYINVYTTPEPQRGAGFMAKRGLSHNENEIARIYKCSNKGLVDILQFYVPRKSEIFQDDLYPDTMAPVPAITAEEWMDGKDADPILMPVRGSQADTSAHDVKSVSHVKKANILSKINTVPAPIMPSGEESVASVQPPRSGHQPVTVSASASAAGGLKPPPSGQSKSVSPTPAMEPAEESRMSKRSSESFNSGVVRTREYQPGARESKGASVPSAANRLSRTGGFSESFKESGKDVPEPYVRRGVHPAGTTVTNGAHHASSVTAATSNGSLPATITVDGTTVNIEEVVRDVQKLKGIIKRQEKRIRFLEELLHEKDALALSDM